MNSQLLVVGQWLAKKKAKKLSDQGAIVPPNFANRHAIMMGVGNNVGLSLLTLNDEASMLAASASAQGVSTAGSPGSSTGNQIERVELEALQAQIQQVQQQVSSLKGEVSKLQRQLKITTKPVSPSAQMKTGSEKEEK